jgi:phosphohistidine swiveling domain-containing protein
VTRLAPHAAAILASLAACGSAWALPTPDTLIAFAQLGPTAYAALTGALGLLGFGVSRRFGTGRRARRTLVVLAALAAAAATGLAVVAGVWMGERRDAAQIRDIAAYLRCDDVFHNIVAESRIRAHLRTHGKPLPFDEIAARLVHDDSAVLVTIGGPTLPRLSYDAGFFAAGPPDRLRRFAFVYAGELKAHLAAQGDAEARSRRSLILDCSASCLLLPEPSQDAELWALIASFRSFNWIMVTDPSGVIADPARIRPRLLAQNGYVAAADGTLVRSRPTPSGEQAWPVRDESIYFRDEAHVRFPNWTRLLGAEELSGILGDAAVYIVAPYYSRLRHPHWQRERLVEYLRDRLGRRVSDHAHDLRLQRAAFTAYAVESLENARVLTVDLSSPTASADIRRLAEKIRGSRFLIASMSSLDWVHGGLDVASAVYQDSRRSEAPFRYLGATLQLADYAALTALAAAPRPAPGPVRWARAAGAQAATALASAGFGTVGALAILAGAAWLLTLPISLPAAVHAARRMLAREQSSLPPRCAWSRRWTERILGYRPGWDLAGGVVLLILLLAGFELLSYRGSPFDAPGGLPAAPSPACQAILAALVALRMGIDAFLGRRQAPGALKLAASAAACAAFALLIVLYVPAAVATFAAVFLVLRSAVDFAVRAREAARLRRLTGPLLADPAAAATARLWDLIENASERHMGGKARVLGRLRRAGSGLFSVPPAALVDAGALFELHDARQRRELEDMVAALRRQGVPEGSRYAVRSSAPDEDGETESMAGQYRSILEVDAEGLRDAIRAVHASYRGAPGAQAVIVQQMAVADFAGVLFTRSADNGAVARLEFVAGFGTGLVDGRAQPTELLIGRASGNMTPAQTAHAGMALQVFGAGMALEAAFGAPIDLEFAYDARRRQLTILQARRITRFTQNEDVAAEQSRLLAAIGAGELPAAFARSPVAEVAEATNPFTLALLLRLYAGDGALGIASRRLGVRPPPALVSAFGRLYVPHGNPWAELRRTLESAATRFRLRRAVRLRAEQLIAECRSASAAKQAGFADPAVAALDARSQAQKVVASLALFVEDIYPSAFAAALLADASNETAAGPVPVRTAATDLAVALAELADGGDAGVFLRRWGHRSAGDYDLSVPGFAEDVDGALRHAHAFAAIAMQWSAARPPSTAAERMLALREEMKDGSLRVLRSLRPQLLGLGAALDLDPVGEVFFLDIVDIGALAAGRLDAAGARAVAARRRRAWDAYAGVSLPDAFTAFDLERLGAGLADREPEDRRRGRMLSVPAGFGGILVTDPQRISPAGAEAVLLTRFLRPQIVTSFDRISGVITSVGGYLSHAAIIARERGIPVLLLPGACEQLRDGDIVQVAASGEVQRRAGSRGTTATRSAA